MSKGNIPLFVISGIAGLFALFFVVLAIGAISSIEKSTKAVDEQKRDVREIKNTSPHPVQENLEKIVRDIHEVETRIAEARSVYGHPEEKILSPFTSALGTTSDSFIVGWKAHVAAQKPPADEEGAQKYLNDFLQEYADQLYPGAQTEAARRLSVAKKRVENYLHEMTVFQPTEQIVDLYILVALRYPFKVDRMNCKFILTRTISEIHKYLKSDSEFQIAIPSDDFYFTFDTYKTSAPDDVLVPAILTQMRMIESIMVNLKRSKISAILNLKRLTEVSPSPVDGFVKYTYELTVRSDQSSARAFLNTFIDAVSNNQFYDLRSVSFKKSVNEEAGLLPTEKTVETRKNAGVDGIAKEDDKPKIEKVLGQNNRVDMTIRFNYIVTVDPQK